MKIFNKRNLPLSIVLLLVMGGVTWGAAIPGARQIWRAKVIGWAATSAGSILSATTDTGTTQTITTGITAPTHVGRISATSGGTAADINGSAYVTIVGTDHNGTSITENLPNFTENSATTVTGEKVFKTVTSITLNLHDGTGATTSVEMGGAPAANDNNSVMTALTDTGVTQTVTTGTSINGLAVPRSLTATAGGTSGDIGAISVTVTGVNEEGISITEVLPAFTVNTAGTVQGTEIFKEVTSISIPAHDGTAATTSIGTGNLVGIGKRLKRNTMRNTYQGGTKETTDGTVTTNSSDLQNNAVNVDGGYDSTQIILEYMETPDGE